MDEIKLPFYARLALVLLAIVLIVHLLVLGQSIFIPLFFSLLIAFLLYPAAKWMQNRFGFSRGLAAFISILAFVIGVGLLLYFTTFQILALSQDIPLLQVKVNAWLDGVRHWIIAKYHIESREQVEYLNNTTNGLLDAAGDSLRAVFTGVTEFIFWTVLVFIYTFFIMYYRRLLLHFIMKLFPREHRLKVRHVVMETRVVTNFYMHGLLIECGVMAVANSAALLLLGVKYALLLGLISALLNFIPYLGIIIATVLTMMITMAHSTPAMAAAAGGVLFVLHVLDANILFPRVVGSKVKMNALITIISVLIGGVLWGVAGMFLAIPITAILKIVFDHIDSLEPWGMLLGAEDKDA